jgi:hypothetical protein
MELEEFFLFFSFLPSFCLSPGSCRKEPASDCFLRGAR